MILRNLILDAPFGLATFAVAADTAWRGTSIEACEGLSCMPETSSFNVFERTAEHLTRAVLQDDSFAVPFADDDNLLSDAPFSELQYVERERGARPSLALTLRNPSDARVGVSLHWPSADVASSRETTGRYVPL